MNQEDTYSDLYSEIILLCFGMLALFIIFYISIFDLFGSAAYLILGVLGVLGYTKIVATYNSMAGMADEKTTAYSTLSQWNDKDSIGYLGRSQRPYSTHTGRG